MNLILTPVDKSTDCWKKLVAHWTYALGRAHIDLETESDPIKSAQLRGRIAGLRNNLALEKEVPVAAD